MKRFYTEVAIARREGGWQVTLDGRGVRTGKGAAQIVPSEALAEALAQEWADQGETLDPALLPMRDQTDHAIDLVIPAPQETIARLVHFAETDTLCYRADPEDALFVRQTAEWEPILAAIERREGVRFTRISGIVHRPQPAATLAALRARIAAMDGFTLAGLFTMASLAASCCIALAALEDDADAEALWRAACLEEEWQAKLWGRDAEAEACRARRQAEFLAAWRWTRLAGQ